MDRAALPAASLKAGEEYDAALQSLGFKAEGLFWAWDRTIEEFVLVLVTDHFDHAGPTQMYTALFDAYRGSATPKELSPFIVRIHSPRQAIIRNMLVMDAFGSDGERSENIESKGEAEDLVYVNHWVYRWPTTDMTRKAKRRDHSSRQREWRRFVQNVDKLAA